MRKKGISLVSLSIAIVVLMALVSTITISLTFSVNNAKKMAFAKEIYNIQSLVDEYIQNEDTIPKTLKSIEIAPTDVTLFNSETLTNGKLLLETLDLQSLGLNSTSYGNEEIGETNAEKSKDVYAISQATGKIYYIAGVNIGGKKYYTLTDELRQMIEKNQELNIAEETITFIPSKAGWSKDAITVKVTVPSGYSSPSVSINNTNIQYSTTTENGVTYYNINTSSIAESYTVTVNYTKGGVTSTASYTTKLDKTAPVISKKASVENIAGKINGLKAVDSGSGIRYFKYVEDIISVEDVISYMDAYGKNITSGSINFKNGQSYTLYAEDKVGNYSVVYLTENGSLVGENAKKVLEAGIKIGDIVTGYTLDSTKSSVITSGKENTAPSGTEVDITTTNTKQTVNQTAFSTWKYVGISENGELMIAPDIPTTGTVNTMKLSGKGGFLEGSKELDYVCAALYSVDNVGTARSINIDDVNNILEYTGPKGNQLTVGQMINNYNITTLTKKNTPDGRDINTYIIDAYQIADSSSYITTNETIKKLIYYYPKNYWLASTYVNFINDYKYVYFYQRCVKTNNVHADFLFGSIDDSYAISNVVRPIVLLKSAVNITKVDGIWNINS